MSGSGGAAAIDAKFKPAFGGVVQADFVWGGFSLGVRSALLSYRPQGTRKTASANSIGISLGYFNQFEGKRGRGSE